MRALLVTVLGAEHVPGEDPGCAPGLGEGMGA